MAIIRYMIGMDAGGVTGTPCKFADATNISGNPSYYQETVNIVGAANATVTLQVTPPFDNSNDSGQVFVKGAPISLGSVFDVILDASGNGNFIAKITGDATQTGTLVRCFFSISGVTTGYVGTPSLHEISKVF